MKWVISLTVSVLVSYISKAQAVEYFVAKNCKTANQLGTMADPFCIIQQGLDKARAGDVVNVREGTYSGSVTFRYSGVEGRPITLKNYRDEKVVVDQGLTATKDDPYMVFFQALGASDEVNLPIGWIVLEGIEIARNWVGIKFANAHDVIVRGCNIHHSVSQGILSGGALRITIDRNIIAHNGDAERRGLPEDTNQIHGIYMSGSNHKITNNIIHSNLGFGIQVAGYADTGADYYTREYGGARGWLIANNTFAYQKNRGAMIVWQSQAQNNTIINNIFYENAVRFGINGVDFYGSGSGNVLKNNLFYSSKELAAYTFSPNATLFTPENNLIDVNPMLRTPASFDFHLKSGSPAINKGIENS